jgi:hypothetical protein
MYDISNTFSYEDSQVTIMALGPKGNKLEIVEWGWSGDLLSGE